MSVNYPYKTFGYSGGKYKLLKRMYPTIQKYETVLGTTEQDFFDPFMGMCSVPMRIAYEYPQRHIYLSDINLDITAFWKGIQNGFEFQHITNEEEFNALKNLPTGSPARGFLCPYSYGGNALIWRGKYQKASTADVTKRIPLLRPLMKNVHIGSTCSYLDYGGDKLKMNTIYVDPPYHGNNINNNKYFQNFNHQEFWEEMRDWSKRNLVFISEYGDAPEDFVSIWSVQVYCTMFNLNLKTKDDSRIRTEHLFIHKSWQKKYLSK